MDVTDATQAWEACVPAYDKARRKNRTSEELFDFLLTLSLNGLAYRRMDKPMPEPIALIRQLPLEGKDFNQWFWIYPVSNESGETNASHKSA